MATQLIKPLSQAGRPPCSVRILDADLGLGNANWMKGLQVMSDWIWSGQLNPVAFPNNLGRYFLQVPAVFEHQLQYSTTLIFDEPSFRNGVRVSGFIDRPVRELVISYIAQVRHCWYSMTHHACLGTLTAVKHGVPVERFQQKLTKLLAFERETALFTEVERAVLSFARAFATNPKEFTDDDFDQLRRALENDIRRRFEAEGAWLLKLQAARAAQRRTLALGVGGLVDTSAPILGGEECQRLVNGALIELAFLCLQFVALADVFTALNIPDENFLPGVMSDLLSSDLINKINDLNTRGGSDLPSLIPERVQISPSVINAIRARTVQVEPAWKTGARIPLKSYECDPAERTRDKGVAVGAVQVGVYGWSFGEYFPGGLVYALLHHPELARFEAPYSLPLLFNEDEWRNGTQTAGFVTRRLKEIVYLRVYTLTRCRYGLEHHTMFLFNAYRDEYGVGRPPNPAFSEHERNTATDRALTRATNAVLYVDDPDHAPHSTYTPLDRATIAWVEKVLTAPHSAYEVEPKLREELRAANDLEIASGTRFLDTAGQIGMDAAHERLLDHQIAELAMITGHMDGLGRAMTLLRLESEKPVSRSDGYFTDRGGLFDFYRAIGVSEEAQSMNELRLNPEALNYVQRQLSAGHHVKLTSEESGKTAEF